MKYIVKKTADIIKRNLPSIEGESMIKVDGFEDICFYNELAYKISKIVEDAGLTVDIKLSGNKWENFKKNTELSSVLASMSQNGWVAENKSITEYRNLHKANLLVLFGTESEEDKGGLINCYCIDSNVILNEIDGKYSEVFEYLDFLSDADKRIIDKLYANLFDYVPKDIIKLSTIADSWENQIENLFDFIELFFGNLNEWGLPKWNTNYPDRKKIDGKKNVLEPLYKFISRSMFKRMTAKKYNDLLNNIRLYGESSEKYSSDWEGWESQQISSYEEYSKTIIEFIQGTDVENNRKKLEMIDFDIILDSINIKNVNSSKKKKSEEKITGNPLSVFTKAVMFVLLEKNNDIKRVTFDITQATIVNCYSDTANEDEDESQDYLIKEWRGLCSHLNGIISFINKRSWIIDDNVRVEIELSDKDIFNPKCALVKVDSGIVKAASANNSVNKIEFTVKCCGEFGDNISSTKYIWEFSDTCSWTHNFIDVCSQDDGLNKNNSFVPLTVIDKMSPLIFAKSEEEFFDRYDESNLNFNANIIDFVNERKVEKEDDEYIAGFIELGNCFTKFIDAIKNYGLFFSMCKESASEIKELINAYIKLGEIILSDSMPQNKRWILDAYIYSFSIVESKELLEKEIDSTCCIIPAWHPATLQKILCQKEFFLEGCLEWWNDNRDNQKISKTDIDKVVSFLEHISLIQGALDLFPSAGQQYYGLVSSFGAFSIYSRDDKKNEYRLKDIIKKDAIFDDDFNQKEISNMNENAQMIYGVIQDYVKSVPNDGNISLVFINPSELQPIVAAIYKYIEVIKKQISDEITVNVNIRILVKPENKGGRNYLAYWMDEFFSEDSNVNIHAYLNEYNSSENLDKMINGNNDIVFVMDLLNVNNYHFIPDNKETTSIINESQFPIVYKPTPISETTVKREIELSQPQFLTSFIHTQVVRFRNSMENAPCGKYIAVKEVRIDEEIQNMISEFHQKAYWVVCIDSGMDGALLKNDNRRDYSIIGFSTGKGLYGQYNLTITVRDSILKSIKNKLSNKLYQLFHWDEEKIKRATDLCIEEAGKLDGISLFSAINPKDYNIREFMAYVLTSLREKNSKSENALKILIHLDSYKHWFESDFEKDADDSLSRPDFLLLEVNRDNSEKLKVKATIVECKIASQNNAEEHLKKAVAQVEHGFNRLSCIFNPNSSSIKRRYWYAQLYRALAFAQVTFSNNTPEFKDIACKLRDVLNGNFDIEWHKMILGYWVDMQGDEENEIKTQENISIHEIPQNMIQKLLLGRDYHADFVNVSEDLLISEEEQNKRIENREEELLNELKDMQRINVLSMKKSVKEKSNENSFGDIELENDNNIISENVLNNNMSPDNKKNDVISNKEFIVHKLDEQEVMIDSKEKDLLAKEGIRILIGKDRLSHPVYWEFGNSQLANRHLLITGTSGQGKTYSIQTMLYEVLKNNVSAVVFDYTEGFREDQLEPEFLEKMHDKVNQRIVYEKGVPINPFKRQEIDISGHSFPEKITDIAERIATIFEHVYEFGAQQRSVIFNATRKGLERYGLEMNMEYFKLMLEEEKEVNKTAQSVISKMEPLFYGISFNNDKSFDWEKVLYPKKSELNIIQLTGIDRKMQVIITELMLWDAWFYTKKVGKKEKPFVVVLDEAQNISHKDDSPSAKILTEGRKFGWSAWYATQSLKVLSDDEVVRLHQAANELYFKPTPDEVPKIARQIDSSSSNSWISPLSNLKKGQCIVVGDRVGITGKFGSSKPTVTSITQFSDR